MDPAVRREVAADLPDGITAVESNDVESDLLESSPPAHLGVARTRPRCEGGTEGLGCLLERRESNGTPPLPLVTADLGQHHHVAKLAAPSIGSK